MDDHDPIIAVTGQLWFFVFAIGIGWCLRITADEIDRKRKSRKDATPYGK